MLLDSWASALVGYECQYTQSQSVVLLAARTRSACLDRARVAVALNNSRVERLKVKGERIDVLER